MRIVVNNQPKGNLDFIMRPISLKLYIFTGYEVQASLRLFKELDSSLRWNDDASEAWTPNPIDRFRTASILCYRFCRAIIVHTLPLKRAALQPGRCLRVPWSAD
jgi:hypothetical protein